MAEGKPIAAYDTCTFVLRELGETIPDSVTADTARSILTETLAMYDTVYGEEWLVKKLEEEKIRTIALIYNKCVIACFLCKKRNVLIYHMCRAVQLSLQNGTCQYTPLALVHLAGYAMQDEKSASIS